MMSADLPSAAPAPAQPRDNAERPRRGQRKPGKLCRRALDGACPKGFACRDLHPSDPAAAKREYLAKAKRLHVCPDHPGCVLAPCRLLHVSTLQRLRYEPRAPPTGGGAAGAPSAPPAYRTPTEAKRLVGAANKKGQRREAANHADGAYQDLRELQVLGQIRGKMRELQRVGEAWQVLHAAHGGSALGARAQAEAARVGEMLAEAGRMLQDVARRLDADLAALGEQPQDGAPMGPAETHASPPADAGATEDPDRGAGGEPADAAAGAPPAPH
jgi:hypothetical protein